MSKQSDYLFSEIKLSHELNYYHIDGGLVDKLNAQFLFQVGILFGNLIQRVGHEIVAVDLQGEKQIGGLGRLPPRLGPVYVALLGDLNHLLLRVLFKYFAFGFNAEQERILTEREARLGVADLEPLQVLLEQIKLVERAHIKLLVRDEQRRIDRGGRHRRLAAGLLVCILRIMLLIVLYLHFVGAVQQSHHPDRRDDPLGWIVLLQRVARRRHVYA